jgi:hypothetical protein
VQAGILPGVCQQQSEVLAIGIWTATATPTPVEPCRVVISGELPKRRRGTAALRTRST